MGEGTRERQSPRAGDGGSLLHRPAAGILCRGSRYPPRTNGRTDSDGIDDRMDAKHSQGEPRALISRSALLHTARVLRRAVGPAVRLCAILKADAYGHGAAVVADALCNFTTSAPARSTDAQDQASSTRS